MDSKIQSIHAAQSEAGMFSAISGKVNAAGVARQRLNANIFIQVADVPAEGAA
jgi:hypothetical protein